MAKTVAIVPAGTWGAALAVPLADSGHQVRLWSRQAGFAAAFNQDRRHPRLPGLTFADRVTACADIGAAVAGADLVILAPASHGLRAVCRAAAPYLGHGPLLVAVTKGIEPETLLTMSEVISDELGAAAGRLAVLSGPNFALEVARRLPTTTVVASARTAVAEAAQDILMSPNLRVYAATDVKGVELGGALKNCVAIAVGISDGLGLGNNARAALITRGLAEIARLGRACGAAPQTFAGLSGLGDLVLTCTGEYSRNRQAGLAIGRGQGLGAYMQAAGAVVEGVPTTRAARELARRLGVDMPIVEELYQILHGNKAPADGVMTLMTRMKTSEFDY